MKDKRGFSLVEVIIVIAILAIIGIIISGILTRSFRAGTQGEVLSKLKQNGDMAVSIMDETIRNSETVVCYGPPDGTYPTSPTRKDQIVVRTLLGKYVKFRFVDPTGPANAPTANGYIVKQENLNSSDFNSFCSATPLAFPTAIEITNRNNTSGVSISDGSFLKIAGTTGKDTITISFNVNLPLKPASTALSDTAKIQTTVQIR